MARLAEYRIGEGVRATVLLHGFLGAGKNLRSLAQRWAALDGSRRLLVPDLTGHGGSPALPPDADLATLADDVLETARGAGLAPPLALVGHSLGGRVALAVARREPAVVSEVVLLDIAPGPIVAEQGSRRVLEVLVAAPDEAPSRRELRQHLIDGGLSPARADWLVMNVRVEEGRARWTFDRQALARLQETTSAEDLWDVLEQHLTAVRGVRGGRSRYVLDADVRRMEAAGCPVETIAGAGHELHVEALDALLGLLTAP
jgi:pimeloyl-ACP methyl ester carboxylesterase